MAEEEKDADVIIKLDVKSESIAAYHRAAFFIERRKSYGSSSSEDKGKG